MCELAFVVLGAAPGAGSPDGSESAYTVEECSKHRHDVLMLSALLQRQQEVFAAHLDGQMLKK